MERTAHFGETNVRGTLHLMYEITAFRPVHHGLARHYIVLCEQHVFIYLELYAWCKTTQQYTLQKKAHSPKNRAISGPVSPADSNMHCF